MKFSPSALTGVLLAFLVTAPWCAARGSPLPRWHGLGDAEVEGRLCAVYGPLAFVQGPAGNQFVPIAGMTDGEVLRVIDFLDSPVARRTTMGTSRSKVARALRQRLQILRAGKLVSVDTDSWPEPQIYLAYFSAGWCPPCHRFTPELVRQYHEIQQAYPGWIEVVMLSSDETPADAASYAAEFNLPWPVVEFHSRELVRPLVQWEASGIPNLVAVTREGDILYSSYHGTEYVGPQDVLDKVTQLLRVLSRSSGDILRARHRIGMVQRARKIGAGSDAVQPFYTALSRTAQQALPAQGAEVEVDVDEHGVVTGTEVDHQSFTPLAEIISAETEHWLFLPAIEHGTPKAATLALHVAPGQ
jgi:thiol-disulfide isomerase/thioredoxin